MNKLLFPLLLLVFIFPACGDDEMTGGNACNSDFNQTALFENIADNLIIPGFESFETEMNALSARAEDFALNPGAETLQALKTNFSSAWVQWQKIAQYNFGPADEVFLRSSLNNFPLNVAETQTKIEAEDTDFSNPDAYDKGFPAIEFLLYGVAETESEVVDFYQGNENAAAHSAYLRAVIADMQNRTSTTIAKWKNEYRNTFVANTGSAAGSALSQIINGLNQNYEFIKRDKIGVPSGVLTLQIPNPNNVEALFSNMSNELAIAALEASFDFYSGIDNAGNNGIGLDDYLNEVNATTSAGASLNTAIINQFNAGLTALRNINADMRVAVEEEKEAVSTAYQEVTRNVVLLKSDMPSILCVSITYIDNPSDSD